MAEHGLWHRRLAVTSCSPCFTLENSVDIQEVPMTKSVVLADPRGFCAGVDRAILTVQTILKAAESSGKLHREDGLPPVYVRRPVSYTHLTLPTN